MDRETQIDIHLLLGLFRCFNEQLYLIKDKHKTLLKLKFNRLIKVSRAYENEILKLNNGTDDLDTIYDELMELILVIKENVNAKK